MADLQWPAEVVDRTTIVQLICLSSERSPDLDIPSTPDEYEAAVQRLQDEKDAWFQ